MIVIDSREVKQAKGILEGLKRLGVEAEVSFLDAGDYLVGDVLIERKTPTGFVSDVRSMRLWKELDKLKRCVDVKPVLVIEGSLSLIEKITRWSPSQVLGTLNSVILDWGIPAIILPSRRWFMIYLQQLDRRAGKIGRERLHPLRMKEKVEKISDKIRFVVEGLPNVSGVRAINLLRRFKTIKALANASLQELQSVEGIGEKIARDIYKVLNTEFQE